MSLHITLLAMNDGPSFIAKWQLSEYQKTEHWLHSRIPSWRGGPLLHRIAETGEIKTVECDDCTVLEFQRQRSESCIFQSREWQLPIIAIWNRNQMIIPSKLHEISDLISAMGRWPSAVMVSGYRPTRRAAVPFTMFNFRWTRQRRGEGTKSHTRTVNDSCRLLPRCSYLLYHPRRGGRPSRHRDTGGSRVTPLCLLLPVYTYFIFGTTARHREHFSPSTTTNTKAPPTTPKML